MDIPCAPILADITVDGRKIKAIAQITKQGWVYVLDRTNGQPVWPIQERPVEKGDVPGEWYSPTQPFVTKPPPFDRQGVSPDDVIDFTPELHAEGLKLLSRYKIGPIFTPPVVSKVEGPLGTLIMPSVTGGANWQGGALDPETNKLYVYSVTAPSALGLVQPDPTKSDFGYVLGVARANAPPVQTQSESSGPARNEPATASGQDLSTAPGARGQAPSAAGGRGQAPAGRGGAGGGGGGGALSVQGLPLIKPPYGRITAIDLNKGDISWQIAHGDTPDNVKNHPALKGIQIPRTGRPGRIGVLVTKNLVIAGEGGFVTTANGQRGAMLRAYDKATGQDAGAVYMPAPQTGSPMTYFYNNSQYILVAVSGAAYTGELLAFKLP
jgi:quinoprotein glucose dehydrogenase